MDALSLDAMAGGGRMDHADGSAHAGRVPVTGTCLRKIGVNQARRSLVADFGLVSAPGGKSRQDLGWASS